MMCDDVCMTNRPLLCAGDRSQVAFKSGIIHVRFVKMHMINNEVCSLHIPWGTYEIIFILLLALLMQGISTTIEVLKSDATPPYLLQHMFDFNFAASPTKHTITMA